MYFLDRCGRSRIGSERQHARFLSLCFADWARLGSVGRDYTAACAVLIHSSVVTSASFTGWK
jgi:hypothetical protein